MPATIDIQVQIQDREGTWHVACHCGDTPHVVAGEQAFWSRRGYPTRIETVRLEAAQEEASCWNR